jgi:hypothetical protein
MYPLAALVARTFFAGLYARGRGDPDYGDEGDEAESQVRVLVRERDCQEVDEE